MNRLEDYLKLHAEQQPEHIAVVCNGETITYRQLYGKSLKRAEEIQKQKESNSIHVFRSTQDADFVVEYLATHMAGAIAVPLEKNTPDERYNEIYAAVSDLEMSPDIADILYTTGTTGKSKGVMVSHKAVIANAENLIDSQGFSKDVTFIINGPLNHIGSLSKLYTVIVSGGSMFLLDGMKDLNALINAFDYSCEKVATFLVPSAIRILLQFSKDSLKRFADKIDFIETGAAPMAHSDMLLLCELLPKTRLYNTYASTETGIISTYNYNDGECLVGCLGEPMKHSQIIITEEGRIACKGDTLMSGYAGDGELTSQVLHDDTIYTADSGEIDDKGRLRLKGRVDDVINIGGYKIAPTEVENAALSVPGVKDCVCAAGKHPVLGTALKLLYVIEEGTDVTPKIIADFLKTRLELYKVPLMYEAVDSIHRTFNGKLDRKFYKE